MGLRFRLSSLSRVASGIISDGGGGKNIILNLPTNPIRVLMHHQRSSQTEAEAWLGLRLRLRLRFGLEFELGFRSGLCNWLNCRVGWSGQTEG